MEYTIRLRDRKIYEAVLSFLSEISQDVKRPAMRQKAINPDSGAFKAVRIKTKGFRFDRDEANAR